MKNPFKDNFYLGQEIKYLGIKMLVTRLNDPYDSDLDPDATDLDMTRVTGPARMVVHYRDKEGILQEYTFEDQDLPALLTETNRYF